MILLAIVRNVIYPVMQGPSLVQRIGTVLAIRQTMLARWIILFANFLGGPDVFPNLPSSPRLGLGNVFTKHCHPAKQNWSKTTCLHRLDWSNVDKLVKSIRLTGRDRSQVGESAHGNCLPCLADHCRASQWPSSMTSAGPPPPVGQLRAQLQQQQMQQKLLELQTQQAQQAQAQFQALLSRNSACMQQSGQGGNYPSRGQIESWLPAELQQSLQQQQQLLPRETQELRGQKHLWQRGGLEEQCVHPPSQAPQLAPPSQLPMLPPPALGSDLSAAQHGALPSYALVQQLLLQGGLTHTSHVELPSQASSASLDDAADTAAAVAGTGGSPQPPFPLGHSLTELLAMVHSQQQQQQHVPPGLPLPYRLSQQQLSQALSLLPGQGLTGLSSQSQGLAPSNQNQSSLSGPAFQEQAPQLLQRPLSQQLSRYPAPLHGRHRSPSVSTWSPAGTVARSQKLTLSPTEM